MKRRVVILVAAAFLVLALAFPAGIPATPNAPERHEEIRAAIDALRNAKGHMERAKHDFGGHRSAALHATDEAIHQLEICLKYD
jgi:hypothetical protein